MGQATNERLKKLGSRPIAQAKSQFEAIKEKVRLFEEFEYGAESWKRERRIILKAEHLAQGANPCYIVTSFSWGHPGWFSQPPSPHSVDIPYFLMYPVYQHNQHRNMVCYMPHHVHQTDKNTRQKEDIG